MNQFQSSANLIKDIKGKRILSFSTRPLWKMHYIMEMALVNHLSSNNTVVLLSCQHSLDTCEANVYGARQKCYECIAFQNSIRSNINNSVIFDKVETTSSFNPHIALNYNVEQLKTIHELTKLKIEDYEIGKAVLNHVIPNHGLNVDLSSPEILRLTKRLIYSLSETYLYLKSYIVKNNIDCGLIFNGRFPHESAFLEACTVNSIDYIIHERATDPNKIGVYINRRPHYTWEIAKNAEVFNLSNLSEPELISIREFASNPYKKWKDNNFTNNQVKQSLPKICKPLISIFLSTQEEYVAIPGAKIEPTLIEKLQKLFDDEKMSTFFENYQVLIRDHPGSLKFTQSKMYQDRLSKYKYVEYLPPESIVDTYALLSSSELVITFGSTVGIEALYRGIKVVCLTNIYSAHSVNLPGVLVYDPYDPDFDKFKRFIEQNYSNDELFETCLKVCASLANQDIQIPGWSYQAKGDQIYFTF